MLSVDSSRAIADATKEVVGCNELLYKYLIDISLTEKSPICWRAVRVVDLCAEEYPYLFLPYIELIICKLDELYIEGLRRGFCRILIRYTSSIKGDSLSKLIDISFRWLLSPNQAIAIQAYCMNILFEISKQEPDIQNELILVLEDRQPYFSSGMIGSSRKVLKKLYQLQLKTVLHP